MVVGGGGREWEVTVWLWLRLLGWRNGKLRAASHLMWNSQRTYAHTHTTKSFLIAQGIFSSVFHTESRVGWKIYIIGFNFEKKKKKKNFFFFFNFYFFFFFFFFFFFCYYFEMFCPDFCVWKNNGRVAFRHIADSWEFIDNVLNGRWCPRFAQSCLEFKRFRWRK